jgi:hypothetical protein
MKNVIQKKKTPLLVIIALVIGIIVNYAFPDMSVSEKDALVDAFAKPVVEVVQSFKEVQATPHGQIPKGRSSISLDDEGKLKLELNHVF